MSDFDWDEFLTGKLWIGIERFCDNGNNVEKNGEEALYNLVVAFFLLLKTYCNIMMFRQKEQKVSTKCWLVLVKENKHCQAFK